MPRKRTGIGPRRKTRATAATAAIAAEAAAVAREKKTVTAAKAAISKQRNQILKKIHLFLEEMEPSQLQRVLFAVASTSFANSSDYKATFNKSSDGNLEKQCFSIEEEAQKNFKFNNSNNTS